LLQILQPTNAFFFFSGHVGRIGSFLQRISPILDDFTKEAVDIVVDHCILGQYVACALDRAARFRSLPITIRIDQGPEFTGKAYIPHIADMIWCEFSACGISRRRL